MQFRVSIPDYVKAGQTIRIRCPDGMEGDIKVPKGLKGGDTFIFEMPQSQLTKPTKSSFLDRDIANLYDLVTALIFGVGVGLSIVLGFIVGVLVVTDPQDED
jgi:hypothetical protein